MQVAQPERQVIRKVGRGFQKGVLFWNRTEYLPLQRWRHVIAHDNDGHLAVLGDPNAVDDVGRLQILRRLSGQIERLTERSLSGPRIREHTRPTH
jgi:hypothetical protein